MKAPLGDAARALQFVRSKTAEWNLDKTRIGATGGSAGACSSLWLAFHDDMADPNSDDPVARESTRLYCAAVNGAQVSLDPKELREWMPNYGYGAHAFGLPSFQSLIDNREEVLKWIKEYSPIEHVSRDDPPIAMFYGGEKPVVGASPKERRFGGKSSINENPYCCRDCRVASGCDGRNYSCRQQGWPRRTSPAPFEEIAVHVVQAPRVGQFLSDTVSVSLANIPSILFVPSVLSQLAVLPVVPRPF